MWDIAPEIVNSPDLHGRSQSKPCKVAAQPILSFTRNLDLEDATKSILGVHPRVFEKNSNVAMPSSIFEDVCEETMSSDARSDRLLCTALRQIL